MNNPIEKHVIVRTRSAGVFAGFLTDFDLMTSTAELRDARRIWYWKGAASLSQLAMEGTSDPDGCKFPVEVDVILLPGVIEVIPTTAQAQKSIEAVPVWAA